MTARDLTASVLICTYNRAALLGETLDSLRRVRTRRPWDVLVVDNNSSDDTAAVVAAHRQDYPVPLRYIFESQQGKSNALNAGLAQTESDIIAFTDDDVLVGPEWLDAACQPLEHDPTVDYTGGPVRPNWGGAPPEWFDQVHGDLWGTLALLDYGREPFIFEERRKVPLGVNMAVRRRLVERIGGFDPALGRNGGRSLMGQEQAEFFARARSAGVRGLYVPTMTLQHYVPAARLSKEYFWRWWFWKGVSRSRLDRMHQITELGLDLSRVPHVAGVPRFMWGTLPRASWAWLRAALRRDGRAAATEEMRLCYAAGYIRARLARQSSPLAPGPAPVTRGSQPRPAAAPASSARSSRQVPS